MTLWAVVPVKPLRLGKSRLSGVLTDDERANLNRRLLLHTIKSLRQIREIDQVLVISRDPQALAIARKQGARSIQETTGSQLNRALSRATIFAKRNKIQGVLVLPADLPLITVEDIHTLIIKAVDPPVVVISPDRRMEGTNALLVSPPGIIRYDFGINSFQKHCDLANLAGARLEVVELPHLALDVDLPDDFDLAFNQLKTLPE
ncbi:MAG: 2-phospho-L-lactate guanylyltransferase [Anaerolineales bacterium]|nr:2-phospho-L-lactate guanylyltransferase [Anaerolineales bacterium]